MSAIKERYYQLLDIYIGQLCQMVSLSSAEESVLVDLGVSPSLEQLEAFCGAELDSQLGSGAPEPCA